jgi:signal peptidase II
LSIIIYYFPRIPSSDSALRIALSLQLAGAIGNLIDRLYQGYVLDFIALLPSFNMPVFNIADLSITTGVIILILSMWIKERESSDSEEHKDDDSDPKRVQVVITEEEPSSE